MNLAELRRWGAIVFTAGLTLALMIGSAVATLTRSGAGSVALVIAALLAFGLIALMMRVELALALRQFEGLGAVLPVFAFSLATLLVGRTPATPAFNEIGAQVIVVLLLALAIDARFFRLRAGRDRVEGAGVAFTMLALAVSTTRCGVCSARAAATRR